MKRISLLFLLVVLACGSVWAATINVPADHATIQAAIDAAVEGNTVLVADGTYKENINLNGKNLQVQSVNGSSATVIDGGRNGSVLTFKSKETKDSTFRGFTIQNGFRNQGAGIYISKSSPTLVDLVIKNNESQGDINGAGIFMDVSDSLVENCIIENNVARKFAGLVILDGSPTIKNSIFRNNKATEEGGGIGLIGGTEASLYNIIIHSNTKGGLLLQNVSGAINLDHLTICGNEGNGLLVESFNRSIKPFNLTNSILSDNEPYQIELSNSKQTTLTLEVTINHCSIESGQKGINIRQNIPFDEMINWDENNIETNPLFISTASSDYRLSDSSPCIGAGILNDDIPKFDIAGNLRPNPAGSKPDIGAYENPLASPIVNIPDPNLRTALR